MSPKNIVETESGEPSSYQHMEKALAQAAPSAGQASRESKNEGNGPLSEGAATGNREQSSGRGEEDVKKSIISSSNADDNPQDDEKNVAHGCVVGTATAPKKLASDQLNNIDLKIKSEEQGQAKHGDLSASSISEKNKAAETVLSEPLGVDSYAGAEQALITTQSKVPPKVIHTEGSVIGGTLSTPIAPGPSPPPASTNSVSSRRPSQGLRRGKWTVEEEAYVARVIQDFNSGFLNAPAGTTLRSYLSDKLQCDPMRITKKFTGDSCIGKRVFHPAVRSTSNCSVIDKAQAELDALERRWRRRLEMQQRESVKKAAASAAAAHAASPPVGRGMVQGVSSLLPNYTSGHGADVEGSPQVSQTALTQAASWLDRANAILRGTQSGTHDTNALTSSQVVTDQLGLMPRSDIEDQMREVQRLIYEGPIVQQTTAGLPHLLDRSGYVAPARRSTPDAASVPVQTVSYRHEQSHNGAEPADKRMRTAPASGAEDAEALVGFLRSVRASAASGEDLSG